jgi:dihydroorotate dehydrogenase
MRVNLREDEKQQTEAKLENQGLEKLVSTLRKSRIESDVFKFKPFKSIVIPQRSAVLRNLKLNQKFWLEKHGW